MKHHDQAFLETSTRDLGQGSLGEFMFSTTTAIKGTFPEAHLFNDYDKANNFVNVNFDTFVFLHMFLFIGIITTVNRRKDGK